MHSPEKTVHSIQKTLLLDLEFKRVALLEPGALDGGGNMNIINLPAIRECESRSRHFAVTAK